MRTMRNAHHRRARPTVACAAFPTGAFDGPAARDRQQELLVVVHAPLGAAVAAGDPVPGDQAAFRLPRRIGLPPRGGALQPGRPRARAGGRRLCRLGHAGHRRIPARTPCRPRRVAGRRARPGSRAQRVRRDAFGLRGPALELPDEHRGRPVRGGPAPMGRAGRPAQRRDPCRGPVGPGAGRQRRPLPVWRLQRRRCLLSPRCACGSGVMPCRCRRLRAPMSSGWPRPPAWPASSSTPWPSTTGCPRTNPTASGQAGR